MELKWVLASPFTHMYARDPLPESKAEGDLK